VQEISGQKVRCKPATEGGRGVQRVYLAAAGGQDKKLLPFGSTGGLKTEQRAGIGP